MAQSKHEIQALLASAGAQPRHRFGQNFMIDQNLVRLVADAGELTESDFVIEVGPGTGTLTEELLKRAGHVIAVEIDRDLAGLLHTRFAEKGSFKLIEADALSSKHSLNEELLSELQAAKGRGLRVKLISNLPYNIASPLVIEMLVAGADLLAFTVQKEVARRLRATPGTEEYGGLSVMAQLLARVELLRTLPPQAFWPAPKVESSLVRMVRQDQLGGRAAAMGAFVAKLFSFRRKTLRRALAQAGFDADDALRVLGIDPKLRPENLSPAQILKLADALGAA